MEERWCRNYGQRKNIVADTGAGRVQRSSRTNTDSRQFIGSWKECEAVFFRNIELFVSELSSTSIKASCDLNYHLCCPPLISSPDAPVKVRAYCANHQSSFHAQTADSWIIVIHTALLMGIAFSSGCASPPVDEHEQVELHLVWLHRNRQHLVEPIEPTLYPLLSQNGRHNFRRD
ncbi:hypothetical protein BLNAU_19920 [Blattamonas nauphoetae]|uniref:Uncharacterized protein n=1 Tax=Blattamonas nauphoetae TaxID=2049346 RepID=A0ABQ9X490_9EUKA|nr:hypothetical protein BLNAU_19920 [Blattamonas nauphoetae]